MGRLQFTENAWDDYLQWSTNDKKTANKINKLIKDILRNGVSTGEGKPEALRGDFNGFYSRRINEKDRIVYRSLDNGDIEIAACKGHYDDK